MADPHPELPPQQSELILAEVRRLEWARDLRPEVLAELAEAAELVRFGKGEILETIEDGVAAVYFVVTGRVHVTLKNTLGGVATEEYVTRGRVLGLFALGLTDHSQLDAQAAEPTAAIRMRLPEVLRLSRHAEFQLAMVNLASDVVKRLSTAERTLAKPKVVGIVHQSPTSRPLTSRLATRLHALGEAVAVAGDEEALTHLGEVPYRQIIRDDLVVELEQRQQALRAWADRDRLLIHTSADHGADTLIRLMSYADLVLWCIRPQDVAAAQRTIATLERHVPDWRDEVYVVWILDPQERVPPHAPQLREASAGDFKITLHDFVENKLLENGIERIIHHLRGIKVGLALGGGAARGMAHLGVLQALESHGICVDMLAGTSAGAMTGTVYGAGMSPGYAVDCFKSDLRLSWLFRHLPGGGYWYLLSKYRWRQFGPMLRKYLLDYQMDQLLIPTFTVGVDLVEGRTLIRDSGDATENILESINLPPLALPIVRSGQAVVDGGLLNNVPANVLIEQGCNFVIASTVTAKLERSFMGITAEGGQYAAGIFPSMKVIMRQNLIQSHSMNAVGVEPADFVIAPDVTSFDLSEFGRADEMAEVGEATANELVGDLRRILTSLDGPLFS